MRSSKLADLKNIARGEKGYRPFRWKIQRLLDASDQSIVIGLGDFLTRKLFQLKSDEPFISLELAPRDFTILAELRDTNRGNLAYLAMLVGYIKSNLSHVTQTAHLDRVLSEFILGGGYDKDDIPTLGATKESNQSVYVMKAYCALFGDSHSRISSYFGRGMYSDWVRQRFLYPLSYYFNSDSTSDQFDFFMRQIFGSDQIFGVEREIIQSLIDDNFLISSSGPFVFYIALLTHPYDALSLLIRFYETQAARSASVSNAEILLLEGLSEELNNSRLSALIDHLRNSPLAFSTTSEIRLLEDLDLDEQIADFYRSMVSEEDGLPSKVNRPLLDSLYRVRYQRYPELTDFFDVTSWTNRYAFTTAGRFLKVVLGGLYMWSRRHHEDEFFDLLAHLELLGSLKPWTLTSPRGYDFLRLLASRGRLDAALDEVENAVELLVNSTNSDSRWWIKRFHWEQRLNESQFRFVPWFAAIRATHPLFGNQRYLSGVDWAVLDKIIDAFRIKPFLNNRDAIYALMLRQTEERRHDTATLRYAIEPWAQHHMSLAPFVDDLADEYGAAAIVFLRRFLSPDEILHLELENNFTAAISERMNALERLVKRFKFSSATITEADLDKEQRAVTSVLSLMSVNANQFEINWDVVRNESVAATEDMYSAYRPLSEKYNSLEVMSQAVKNITHIFANKQSGKYAVRNSNIHAALMAISVVDVFLSHPAHGIESVLAIRIRHDNIRREFDKALEAARAGLKLRHFVKNEIFRGYKEQVSAVVREWVKKYMHTGRVSPETAIFNFIPSQEDLDLMIEAFAEPNPQEALVDAVVEWIRNRLDEHLATARDALTVELVESLKLAISETSQNQSEKYGDDVRAAERVAIQSVVKTADELREWFKAPVAARAQSITFRELLLAVEGRFEQEVRTGELMFSRISARFEGVVVKPDSIRNLFVALSELTLNAVKYRKSKSTTTRIRVTPVVDNSLVRIIFSSPRDALPEPDQFILGRPSGSYTEGIFNSGNTGLEKIAFLAASAIGEEARITVHRRRKGFHVTMPIQRHTP